MNSGIIGSVVGPLVGVAGGLIGTYVSIKNTKSARERAFAVRAAIVCWAGVSLFLLGLFLWPQARGWIAMLYCVLFPLGIRFGNKKHMAIRREEETNAANHAA
jgi:hypothetical protein